MGGAAGGWIVGFPDGVATQSCLPQVVCAPWVLSSGPSGACPVLVRLCDASGAGSLLQSELPGAPAQLLPQNLTLPRNNQAPRCSPALEEGGNLAGRGAEVGEREESLVMLDRDRNLVVET